VSSLEQTTVGPSHYEVTVVTISCGISVCKSKFVICEGASVEEELVENGKESNRVRFWAHTAIKITDCRVRHMTFVVRRVKVFPIPAGGEVYLRSHCVALTWRKPFVLYRATIENAHYMNSSLCGVTVVLSASERITRNHPESIGESQRHNALVTGPDARCVVASPLLIVHRRMGPWHQLPHVVCSHVVQMRYPVIAVVNCLVAGGCGGLRGIHWSHVALEGVSANDAVHVGGGFARLDDGVRPLDGERCTVHGKGVAVEAGNEKYEHAKDDKCGECELHCL